jgi:hypothetical protein
MVSLTVQSLLLAGFVQNSPSLKGWGGVGNRGVRPTASFREIGDIRVTSHHSSANKDNCSLGNLGGLNPICLYAAIVAVLPRGVRLK